MFRLFYVLLIPVLCFGFDYCEIIENVNLAKKSAGIPVKNASDIKNTLKATQAVLIAKKCAFKKTNPLMPKVISMNVLPLRTFHEPLKLTYAKLAEAPDVPKLPEMQMMDAYYLKADLKEHSHLESRIHIERIKMDEIRKLEAHEVKKDLVVKAEFHEKAQDLKPNIKNEVIPGQESMSNFIFLNSKNNKVDLVILENENKKRQFDVEIPTKGIKIKGNSIRKDFEKYLSALNSKKDISKYQQKLNVSMNTAAKEPFVFFFDALTPNKNTPVFTIPTKELDSIVLFYQRKSVKK